MRIEMPAQVKKIIGVLEENGYEAFAVGGCVRDSVLGRTPNDWDITTSALPDQTKALFKRTIDTGIQHGTVTVLLDGTGYEVTTYRIDGEYEDGRHPKEVTFTRSLREDLRRRDFTINAMAYSDRTGLIDAFDGLSDLKAGVIRCVGEARERFTEDALRILRAVRFSAQLGFAVEEGTRAAARRLAPSLKKISAERIQTELVKLLVSDHPEELQAAWEMGITEVVLPELGAELMRGTAEGYALRACRLLPPDKALRLAALLGSAAPAGEETAERVLRRLKFDNDTRLCVRTLVRYREWDPAQEPAAVRRMAHRAGTDCFWLLLALIRAEARALGDEGRLKRLEKTEELWQEILARGDCLSLKDLAVAGGDLIADGMRPGREIGDVLKALLDTVLAEPSRNEREYLLAESRKLR